MADFDYREAFFNGWGPSKFSEVVEKVKAAGEKWTDPDFPPNETSLYKNPQNPPSGWPEVTEWKRANEFGPEPKMFLDGADPGDVIQGVLGDCWFLGALSVVATRDDLVQKVVVNKELNEQGVYEFRFFKNGHWRSVLVDDWIPTHNGKPIFSHCKNLNECWVMLLEKAYAKTHRCYENLEGGDETYAFADLTAAVPETIDLDAKENKASVADESLYSRVDQLQDQGHFTGCAKLVTGGQAEADTGNGILQNHAYGIVDIKQISTGAKLLRIRNPWGQGEWKGRWSDGAEEWNEDLLKELDYAFADDGTFWMEFSDFVQQFNRLYVNRIFERNDWTFSEVRSEWVGNAAGGCGNFPSWPNNPQFGFELKETADVLIVVTQRDVRQEAVGREPQAIGFILLKSSDPRSKVKALKQPDFVGMTQFQPKRDISKVFNQLKPGGYIISPSTFQPRKEVQFAVRAYIKGDGATLIDVQTGQAANASLTPLEELLDEDAVATEQVLFKKYDKDGSGFISTSEFQALVYDLGAHLTDDEVAVALEEIAQNGSGKLTYDAFLQWWTGANKMNSLFLDDTQKLAIQRAASYFRKFDSDNSGTLSSSEFTKLHKSMLGNNLSEVQLQKWMKALDKDGNGQIDFNEYINWLLKSGAIPSNASRSKKTA